MNEVELYELFDSIKYDESFQFMRKDLKEKILKFIEDFETKQHFYD